LIATWAPFSRIEFPFGELSAARLLYRHATDIKLMVAIRTRNPLVQITLIALAAVLGIGSRRYAHALPGFVTTYAGDTLWALAAFAGIGLLLPRVSTLTIALLAMILSIPVELSQLYHAPWIDSIRQTTLGGLILGFGFLWSDLACYPLGVGLGAATEIIGGIVPTEERS
jgi:hypothetical protein